MAKLTVLEKQERRLARAEKKKADAEAERIAGIPAKQFKAAEVREQKKKLSAKTSKGIRSAYVPPSVKLKAGASMYKLPAMYTGSFTTREITLLKNEAYERKYTPVQFLKMAKAFDQQKLVGDKK